MYDTSPERCVPGAVPGVRFMLISAVLCLQFQLEDCTFCKTKHSKIVCHLTKIVMHYKLSGKGPIVIIYFSC